MLFSDGLTDQLTDLRYYVRPCLSGTQISTLIGGTSASPTHTLEGGDGVTTIADDVNDQAVNMLEEKEEEEEEEEEKEVMCGHDRDEQVMADGDICTDAVTDSVIDAVINTVINTVTETDRAAPDGVAGTDCNTDNDPASRLDREEEEKEEEEEEEEEDNTHTCTEEEKDEGEEEEDFVLVDAN